MKNSHICTTVRVYIFHEHRKTYRGNLPINCHALNKTTYYAILKRFVIQYYTIKNMLNYYITYGYGYSKN